MLDDSSMMFPETAHFSGRVVHDLSIDMTETKDGYSFEPIINGELLDEDSLNAIVTEDQLTEINYHFKQVKKTILDSLKDIPTK